MSNNTDNTDYQQTVEKMLENVRKYLSKWYDRLEGALRTSIHTNWRMAAYNFQEQEALTAGEKYLRQMKLLLGGDMSTLVSSSVKVGENMKITSADLKFLWTIVEAEEHQFPWNRQPMMSKKCLFGRAPYASKSFRELEEKIWDPKPVELPYGVEVTDNCRDLLLRLLKRSPGDRISFEEFFEHPFLDLEHAPSEKCLPKATRLVKEAVELDSKGDYPAAVQLYCEAVSFFLPAIRHERDKIKREALRKKAKEYMNRAEEIKTELKPHRDPCNTLQRATSRNNEEELVDLYKGCDEMVAAVKLVNAAVIEEDQEDFELALKHYELALGTAIQYLKSEQKGRRKDLLRENADKWMSHAERIKSYLAVKKCSNVEEQQEKEEETEQSFLNTVPCRVQ